MARPVIRIIAPAPPMSEPTPSPAEVAALASVPAAPVLEPAALAGDAATSQARPAPAVPDPAGRSPAGPARVPADRILALTPAASRARLPRRA